MEGGIAYTALAVGTPAATSTPGDSGPDASCAGGRLETRVRQDVESMPELQRRRALDLDVKAYGRWLLDWLYDQTDIERVAEIAQAMADGDPFVENMLYGLGLNDTRPFFARLGLPGITGHPVAAYLDARGWAQTGDGWYDASDILTEDDSDPMEQDVESPRLRMMPAGADVVRRNRASRRDTAPADRPLTERLLRWLYSETVLTGRPAGLVNFMPSDYAIRDGAPGFTLREVQDTVGYLHEKGLVTDPGRQPARGLGPQLVALTPGGRECHNGCNANVGQYLERGNSRRQDHGHHVEIRDSTAVVLSFGSGSAQQHINAGVPVAEALRFADFVSQVAAVLHPVEGGPADYTALAGNVHGEAASNSPDKRRLRHFIDALMHALKTAAPEAVAYTAIELGEKALHALGA